MVLSRFFGKPTFPREPLFAGRFYPADPAVLRKLLEAAMIDGPRDARAIIVPHSDINLVAALAGAGYGRLARSRRTVVVGPSHKIPFSGFAVPNADGFTSPLGTMKVDTEAYDQLGETTAVRVLDVAFDAEPALELQIPWLQIASPKTSVVPLLCGDLADEQALRVMDDFVDDESTLVVAAELARDLPPDELRMRDEATLTAIEGLDADAIGRGDVSSRTPVRALLQLAASRRWKPEILDYRTSDELGAAGELAAGFMAIAFRGSDRA